MSKLQILIAKAKPDLIFLSETHITIKDILDSVSRHTGGVIVYVRNNINFSVIFNENFKQNTWLLETSTYSTQLKSLINSVGMKQFVKSPTRITNISSTLIDIVMSNNPKLLVKVLDKDN